MKKMLFTIATLISCIAAFSQNIWIGGTPGKETDWMEARNWSRGVMPGIQDDVIIPYQWNGYYPKVQRVAPTIGHLQIGPGAQLVIAKTGVLVIDGSYKNNCGLALDGSLHNEGALVITATLGPAIEGDMQKLDNYGICSEITDEGHVTLATTIAFPLEPGNALAKVN